MIVQLLPLVNLSRSSDESKLAQQIRDVRGLIFWSSKSDLWETVLESTSVSDPSEVEVTIDRFSSQRLRDQRKVDRQGEFSTFGQTFQAVHEKIPARSLRVKKDQRAWKVVFAGEFSDDYGGPYRNAIEDICDEMQSQVVPLFVACPNRRSKIGLNQDKFIPQYQSNTHIHMKMYEFVGKLMGVAIRSKNLLNLDFPSIVWKSLVKQKVKQADVLAMDSLAFRVLNQIQKVENNASIPPEMYGDVLGMNFVITVGDGSEVELLPDGENIEVTHENIAEFKELVLQKRCTEFTDHCAAIRRGLATIVPYPLLSLFTWEELELQVSGRPTFDPVLLKEMTKYEMCSTNDPHIGYFWEMLENRFDDIERAQFLKFVWGRSRMPLKKEDFESHFKISHMAKSRDNPDHYLPLSHTCFFSLELPAYSSLDMMCGRVSYAIKHCVTIDADGTSVARRAAAMTTNEESTTVEDLDQKDSIIAPAVQQSMSVGSSTGTSVLLTTMEAATQSLESMLDL